MLARQPAVSGYVQDRSMYRVYRSMNHREAKCQMSQTHTLLCFLSCCRRCCIRRSHHVGSECDAFEPRQESFRELGCDPVIADHQREALFLLSMANLLARVFFQGTFRLLVNKSNSRDRFLSIIELMSTFW